MGQEALAEELQDSVEEQEAHVICADTIASACELVKYDLQQFKYLCIAGTNDDAVDYAQKLPDGLKINLAPGEGFSTERIFQSGLVKTRRKQAMDKALELIIQHDWIAKLPDGTAVDDKPRRRAYMLNPKA